MRASQETLRSGVPSAPAAGDSNAAKGRAFEDLACRHLESVGYRIVERNYRPTMFSEVDILAFDGECLVAVEVKGLSRGLADGSREEFIIRRVSGRKLAKIRSALEFYRSRFFEGADSRIDVVLISGRRLFHYKNVTS